LDDKILKIIEQSEHVNYGMHIVAPVMKSIYKQYYFLLEIDFYDQKHYYLINNEIYENFDIQGFFDEFLNLYHQKRGWHQSIEFQSLISKHGFKNSEHLHKKIKNICDTIINQITGLSINPEGNYIRNPIKLWKSNLLIEFIREHAEQLMSPQTIFDELNKKYPGLYRNPEQIRSLLHINKNIKCLGHKGLFVYYDDPDKADIPFENSIPKMIIRYLETKDYPVYIYELKQYLDKFIGLSEMNLNDNLKNSAKRYNYAFNKMFYYLKGKVYKQDVTNYKYIPKNLLENIKNRTGQLLYQDLPIKHKPQIDDKLQSGEYIIEERGALLLNIEYNKLIENLTREYEIEPIQVLSVIEPEIKKGTFYLDDKNRLRLSANAIIK
jgi:hypothetical protein